jgi:hypothetical protein
MTELEKQLTALEFQFYQKPVLNMQPEVELVDDKLSVATEPMRRTQKLKSQASHSRHAQQDRTVGESHMSSKPADR